MQTEFPLGWVHHSSCIMKVISIITNTCTNISINTSTAMVPQLSLHRHPSLWWVVMCVKWLFWFISFSNSILILRVCILCRKVEFPILLTWGSDHVVKLRKIFRMFGRIILDGQLSFPFNHGLSKESRSVMLCLFYVKTSGQWLHFSRTVQCMHSFSTPKFFNNMYLLFLTFI